MSKDTYIFSAIKPNTGEKVFVEVEASSREGASKMAQGRCAGFRRLKFEGFKKDPSKRSLTGRKVDTLSKMLKF